jgi:hypothetical protein
MLDSSRTNAVAAAVQNMLLAGVGAEAGQTLCLREAEAEVEVEAAEAQMVVLVAPDPRCHLLVCEPAAHD